MKVFLIPSWYPRTDSPAAGVFIKDQALAITSTFSELKCAVSVIDKEFFVYAKHPLQSIREFLRYLAFKNGLTLLCGNLAEFRSRTLLYSRMCFDGDVAGIVRTHEKNLKKAIGHFGDVDVIHAQVSYPAGYAAMVLSKRYNIPYVITEQMSPFPFDAYKNDAVISRRLNAAIKNASEMACLSESARQDILGYSKREPRVIPNCVPEDFFTPGNNSRQNKPFTFFTLCLMSDQKGIPDLLNAIARVTEKNPEVRFRIGGDGPMLDSYRSLAENLKIGNVISWLGMCDREQARDEYRNCNAFILPSKHESLGVVYIEALACGKPVIATRCGGPDATVTESNGLLVEVGNVEQIAAAITFMVDNVTNYDPEKIRDDFLQRFSTTSVAHRIVAMYRDALSQRQQSANSTP
jgi:glycosyltransferase involved in cell wall biosynthesis